MQQHELASLLGVSLNTYGRYERGESSPDVDVLERLISMGIDVHWLLTGAPAEHQRAPAEVDPQLMGMIVDAVRAACDAPSFEGRGQSGGVTKLLNY